MSTETPITASSPLTRLSRGIDLVISSIDAEPNVLHRLRILGVEVGNTVQIVGKSTGGALVLGVGIARIAVENSIARRVFARPAAAAAQR